MRFYSLAADAVVVLHISYVLFVVLGLLAIAAGGMANWQWVRNRWFRASHTTMIAVVVIEALLSITCPLTTLERHLRHQAGETASQGSFVGRLAHDLLFYDLPPHVFTIAYCIFGSVVLATLWLVPPNFTNNRTT
ncbi:DUF2784 domain-containing protein [Aureliella helgolandensis]|uniref:DUF2784 domain-containing protein n=1 Tax=Aureliella helgolandensis TaxID=2527968 RepID=A0A518G9T4_9BACT|nr:DUF2784 domain-containing protein [Aureliella helgolandensis]QDV25357.1 hypothetical protein Q31a_36830 [Aureliella helgolandensis]